jgi:RimJ/RimL family protein N-acetyltransferase
MIAIVPFDAGHVARISQDPLHQAIAADMARLGPGETLLEDGEPVAAAGLARLWPGVAEGWFLARPDLTPRQRLTVARTVARRLPEALQREGVQRFQASVRLGVERAAHLVEWLGLTPEGIMRAYGPDGADHIRYAWVRP